jgi:hypothetical protein
MDGHTEISGSFVHHFACYYNETDGQQTLTSSSTFTVVAP